MDLTLTHRSHPHTWMSLSASHLDLTLTSHTNLTLTPAQFDARGNQLTAGMNISCLCKISSHQWKQNCHYLYNTRLTTRKLILWENRSWLQWLRQAVQVKYYSII